MAIVQEQAIEWLAGLKAMQENPAFFEAACAFVPTIPVLATWDIRSNKWKLTISSILTFSSLST